LPYFGARRVQPWTPVRKDDAAGVTRMEREAQSGIPAFRFMRATLAVDGQCRFRHNGEHFLTLFGTSLDFVV
jgi:hypothetical protein